MPRAALRRSDEVATSTRASHDGVREAADEASYKPADMQGELNQAEKRQNSTDSEGARPTVVKKQSAASGKATQERLRPTPPGAKPRTNAEAHLASTSSSNYDTSWSTDGENHTLAFETSRRTGSSSQVDERYVEDNAIEKPEGSIERHAGGEPHPSRFLE